MTSSIRHASKRNRNEVNHLLLGMSGDISHFYKFIVFRLLLDETDHGFLGLCRLERHRERLIGISAPAILQ